MKARGFKMILFVAVIAGGAFVRNTVFAESGGCYQCHSNGYCEDTPPPSMGYQVCCDPNGSSDDPGHVCLNFCRADGGSCQAV